jgi:hypothetical protein
MATLISIEPSDFALPPGPKIVVVRIDLDSLQHLDLPMVPLTDADSSSSLVLSKGRPALERARLGISTKLFGADFPCLNSITCWPQQPRAAVALDKTSPFHLKYIGFYFKYDVGAGDLHSLRPPVFDLTSEGDLVGGCVYFYAREAGEDRKDGVFENIGFIEDGMKEQAATGLQAAQAQ